MLEEAKKHKQDEEAKQNEEAKQDDADKAAEALSDMLDETRI